MSIKITEADSYLAGKADAYAQLAGSFINDITTALSGPMESLYISIVGLWIVIQGMRMVMAMTTPLDVLKESIHVLIAGILLKSGDGLIRQAYDATLAVMASGSGIILETSLTTNSEPFEFTEGLAGMTKLVVYTELGVKHVFGIGGSIISQTTLTNWLPLIYGVLLLLPYIIIFVNYFTQVVAAIFRAMVVATLSPYLLMCYGFGFFRGQAVKGAKTMISAVIIMWSATCAIGVLMYGLAKIQDMNAQTILSDDAGVGLFNSDYFVVMVMGWLGAGMLRMAVEIGNSITESAFTNESTNLSTKGIIGSGAALAVATAAPTAAAMKYLGSKVAGATGGVSNKAEDLIAKYNDYSTPDHKKGNYGYNSVK